MAELRADNVLRLPDGRLLGYAEYGDPAGAPLFFFHGTPGSRLAGRAGAEAAAQGGVRLVAPDRPGFGLSDFQPGRRLVDWPGDVVALADALDIDRFAVAGVSGGGPCAAACAWKIPERLTAVGLISGVGPVEEPAATEGMSRNNRLIFGLGRRAPWLLRPPMAAMGWLARRSPQRMLDQMLSDVPEADRRIVERDDVRAIFADDLPEAFRQGARGAAYEFALYTRPWGVPLEQIGIAVHLWQGEADVNVPPSMGRYLAATIPDCRARFIPGAGHFWLFDHLEEIFATLVPSEPGVAVPPHLREEAAPESTA